MSVNGSKVNNEMRLLDLDFIIIFSCTLVIHYIHFSQHLILLLITLRMMFRSNHQIDINHIAQASTLYVNVKSKFVS